MREILFRGQTRRYGEQVWMSGEKVPSNWVYGGIFQGTGDFSVIYGADKEDFTGVDLAKHTVYTDTVGQFTGLTDKNGKRIFEGDIVFHGYTKGTVVFESQWRVIDRMGFWTELDKYEWEVIGNIHDSPEMLQKAGVDNG